jgi:hypothetical protein
VLADFLAFLFAAIFAFSNNHVRRRVLNGFAARAMAITVPIFQIAPIAGTR